MLEINFCAGLDLYYSVSDETGGMFEWRIQNLEWRKKLLPQNIADLGPPKSDQGPVSWAEQGFLEIRSLRSPAPHIWVSNEIGGERVELRIENLELRVYEPPAVAFSYGKASEKHESTRKWRYI